MSPIISAASGCGSSAWTSLLVRAPLEVRVRRTAYPGPEDPGGAAAASPRAVRRLLKKIIFFSPFKAKHGLPYLSGVLFDQETHNAAAEDNVVLARNFGADQEKRPNLGDTGESLCVQYASLCVFPNAQYVCSNFTAGQSQVSFGSNFCRKADCLVAVDEDQVEMEEQGEDVEVSEGCWVRGPPRPKRSHRRRFLIYLNYHGMIFHGHGRHLEGCRKRDEEEDEEVAPPFKQPRLAAGRHDQDDLKSEYAQALTSVDPDRLVIEYQTLHECELLHGTGPPDPRQWHRGILGGGKTRKPKHDAWNKYKTVREYLLREHPVDSCLGTLEKRFTQKKLVKKILDSGFNSEHGEYGGFIAIQGGVETRTDDGVLPRAFGFCHQRSQVRPHEVGNFTRLQAKKYCGGNESLARAELDKLAVNQRTHVRTSFSPDKMEVLSLDYFRFLCVERGLSRYTVKHFIWYRIKHYLDPFVAGMLQRRYDLPKVPESQLMSTLLK